MRKRDELTNSEACMARARDDEVTFVLLGRDAAAPAAIRAWIAERIRLGKNQPGDAQLVEAECCAQIMEAERGFLDEVKRLRAALREVRDSTGDPAILRTVSEALGESGSES